MANEKVCFECGSVNDIHSHHVVPRSLGGTKTVFLCGKCHSLAHGTENMFQSNHTNLIRLGLIRAKESGKKLGRPTVAKKDTHLAIRLSIEQKAYLKCIAKANKVSMSEMIIKMIKEEHA